MLENICYRVIRFVPVVQVHLWSGMLITLEDRLFKTPPCDLLARQETGNAPSLL